MPLNLRRRRGLVRGTLAAGVLAAFLLANPAAATVFMTSKTADTADGVCDWDCSLREAVHAANVRRGSDVIVLRPGVYRLEIPVAEAGDTAATGDLDLLDLLVISGAGAGLTAIDGGSLDRVLDVGPTATVELLDLTVRHGTALSGGGIRNAGALTLSRVTVRDNEAAGDGGGILSSGQQAKLTLAASTVAGNQAAGDGGGILAGGSLQLRNATLSGNLSGGDGGGLLVLPASQAALANVTVVHNTAATQGGGIMAAGATTVANSIVAANQAPNHPDATGTVDSAGHNLWGVGAELVLALGDTAGSTEAPLDPLLAPLAANGGPTETHFPKPGSPAINAGGSGVEGAPACQPSDQRGAARGDAAAAERCDIGAVETTRACVPGGSHLCLAGGRFEVAAQWRTTAASGPAQAVPLTADSGSFWFFEPSRLELTVKLVDGCAFNGRHWFFASGLTDVEVSLTVRDTSTGAVRQSASAGGRAFPTVLDTNAFACQ